MSSTTWKARPTAARNARVRRVSPPRQRPAAIRAEQHRGPDQRAGLEPVHALKCGQRRAAARPQARSIAWPPAMPRDPDAVGEHAGKPRRRIAQVGAGEHFEGQRLQGIAGQQRRRLAERDMTGRLAAAQHVVVHARQVVVDERIGVDQLDRGRGIVDARGSAPARLARRIGEQRAQRACRRRPRSASPRAGSAAARWPRAGGSP